jgi:hypothetical protein
MIFRNQQTLFDIFFSVNLETTSFFPILLFPFYFLKKKNMELNELKHEKSRASIEDITNSIVGNGGIYKILGYNN